MRKCTVLLRGWRKNLRESKDPAKAIDAEFVPVACGSASCWPWLVRRATMRFAAWPVGSACRAETGLACEEESAIGPIAASRLLPAEEAYWETTMLNELLVTGEARAELAAVDEWVRGWMAENKVPGAAVAIARQGDVVYARGFGLADRE